MSNVLTISRQSREFVEIIIKVDGRRVTSGVEFSVVADGLEAGVFTPAATVPDKVGVVADHMAPGVYRVYARISDGGYQPVRDSGIFVVR